MFDLFRRATVGVSIVVCLTAAACHSGGNKPLGARWTGGPGLGGGDRGGTVVADPVFGNETLPGAPVGADTVYFEYNSYALGKPAMVGLERFAREMNSRPGMAAITIEGHCDERGTQEYNLALGERRADAVRKFLAGLGVSRERISTISYGEEMPADHGHDEVAWTKNRRTEFRPAS